MYLNREYIYVHNKNYVFGKVKKIFYNLKWRELFL